ATWIEKPPPGWQVRADLEMQDICDPSDRLNVFHDNCFFLYIQMKLCKGSLEDWLRDNQEHPRDPQRIDMIFKQIVEAIAYIHDTGVFHRDLKPSNILFDDNDRIRVCDLGIASEFEILEGQEITATRTANIGTPLYSSPEQRYWRYSSKVDVFALGLILVELCVRMTAELRKRAFDNYRNGEPNYFILIDDDRTRELITQLTKVESEERPTCREILDMLR
ncbi:hypothetical protein PFISCL1PPCAC_17550, partial [Pristionchus fissidentatus]